MTKQSPNCTYTAIIGMLFWWLSWTRSDFGPIHSEARC